MINPLHFKSYFKFLGRNKLYTAINILGLSVSLMFVIIIAVYTWQELSIDRSLKGTENVYTIGTEDFIGSGYGLITHMYSRYPEIEKMTAVHHEFTDVGVLENKFIADIMFADSTFFDIFPFETLEGDPKAVLRTKTDVLVSESFAAKAFGTTDPVGQAINISTDFQVVVGGIVKDFKNSLFNEFDILMNMENVENHFNGSISNKHMNNAGGVVLFMKTYPGTNIVSKTGDMHEYFKTFYWPYVAGHWKEVSVIPYGDIYFNKLQTTSNAPLRQGEKTLVTILLSVGILILIFAIINYINLTVAQTGFRAKEMASRKLLGASGNEIFLKFITESTLMCLIAFILGLLLAGALQNQAGNLLSRHLDIFGSIGPVSILASAGLVLVLGIVSGIVPATFISRYKPIDVVRGSFRLKSKMVFSKVFIVFQNIITIALIAGAITMLLQIRHMINAPLGYNMKDIINIDNIGFTSADDTYSFKNNLEGLAVVDKVSLVQGTPLNGGNNNTFTYKEKNISLQMLRGDSTFFSMLGFEVLKDNRSAQRGVWLNEQAYAEFDLTDNDFELDIYGGPFAIEGKLKDFRLRDAINDRVQPVIVEVVQGRFYPWGILVQITGDRDEALKQVKEAYESYTGTSFPGKYMEEIWKEAYSAQRRILTIVTIFTIIAILISMLGLLAMSTYFIQQRASEIAVRKVFGSTRAEVFRKLVANFLMLVLIAFVIAAPVIWYIMRQWLMDYPYRINLSPMIFISAGALALLIAAITVSWQSGRAANGNPIDSIKS